MNRRPLLFFLIFMMIMTTLTACTKPETTPEPTEPTAPVETTAAPPETTTVPEETSAEEETLSPSEAKQLKSAHPDAFGLDTSEGLKVLAFGDNKGHFGFRIISGSLDYYPVSIAIPATVYPDLTVEETKKLLLFYGLPDEQVTLHPWQEGISSYLMKIDDKLLQDLSEAFDNRYEIGPEIKEDLSPEEKRFDRYVYPITVDSEDWFNYTVQEKVEMLRIDEAVLKNMNERELVWAIADYPYLGNLGAYNNNMDLLAEECDALRELQSRDTYKAALNAYGEEVITELKKEPVTVQSWMVMTTMKEMVETVYGVEMPWEIPYPEEEPVTGPTGN